MLLPRGQVIRFRGRAGIERAKEFEREYFGRCEREGAQITMTHATHSRPVFSAEVEQFDFHGGVPGRNGRSDATRISRG